MIRMKMIDTNRSARWDTASEEGKKSSSPNAEKRASFATRTLLRTRDSVSSSTQHQFLQTHSFSAIKVPQDLDCFPSPVLYLLAEKEFQGGIQSEGAQNLNLTLPGPYDPKLIQSTLASLNVAPRVAESKYWPGTTHGFCTRVDESVPELKTAKDEALDATIGFFKVRIKSRRSSLF